MSRQPVIVGAGLAGLLAAHAWPQCPVLELAPSAGPSHQALLRFRGDSVSRLTGIEFRPVQVRKAIFADGEFVSPSIALANAYSLKCLGRLVGDRSIWNLEPVQRWIAPPTFYDQLLESVGPRITWGETGALTSGQRLISTAPLPATLEACGIRPPDIAFERSPIFVKRTRVPRCDLFQTIYFPGPETALYRASITGDTLIAEFIREPEEDWLDALSRAFWLPDGIDAPVGVHRQKYGKIAPVDDARRKALLFHLTHKFDIFSLGRFATWRNVLLDDVVEDIAVLKRLMRGDHYERIKGLS